MDPFDPTLDRARLRRCVRLLPMGIDHVGPGRNQPPFPGHVTDHLVTAGETLRLTLSNVTGDRPRADRLRFGGLWLTEYPVSLPGVSSSTGDLRCMTLRFDGRDDGVPDEGISLAPFRQCFYGMHPIFDDRPEAPPPRLWQEEPFGDLHRSPPIWWPGNVRATVRLDARSGDQHIFRLYVVALDERAWEAETRRVTLEEAVDRLSRSAAYLSRRDPGSRRVD